LKKSGYAEPRRDQTRVGAVIALAAAVAFVLWLILRNNDSGETQQQAATASATAVSQETLQTLRRTLGRPIYWAGPQSGKTYELTRTPDGRVYVRYLSKESDVGTDRPYLTIGTYPVSGAFAVTRRVAQQPGTVRLAAGNGAVAFYRKDRPTNVYVAFPGSNYQIEVFAPSAGDAQELVSSGHIRPLQGSAAAPAASRATAVATSPAKLKKLASQRGRAIYWAGTRSNTTYELTRTPDGRIYVRYLPAGVKVGVAQPYLTVATYPLSKAFAATRTAAAKPGTVKVPIDGGIAFYSKARPTNVYVAFRGVNEQIEVFDPAALRVRALVTSDRIRPVS
jgi:hypothetical protein